MLLTCCQAFNMATQRDSQIMKELGVAATEDSSAMRTIAVVTMFFLPPTFISVGVLDANGRYPLTIHRLFLA